MAAADKWAYNRGEIVTFIPCLSGCVPSLLWCCLCQTATIIIWSLGKRRKRPKPKPTAAAATPNEPKGTKRTRRRHSVQCHPTHNAVTRCMQIHYLSAQDVSGRRRSLAPPQRNGISAPKFELLKIQRHSRNLIKFSSFLPRFRAAQSKTKPKQHENYTAKFHEIQGIPLDFQRFKF